MFARANTRSYSANSEEGFTLVELMITVAIIGILAAVAWPGYQSYVLKTYRSEGQQALLEIMQSQERWFADKGSYTTSLDTDLKYPASPVLVADSRYSIAATACSGATIQTCVTLTATAAGAQSTDGNLALSSNGSRTGNW